MVKIITFLFIGLVSLNAKDYTNHPTAVECMTTLEKEYNYSKEELSKLFSKVDVQKSALKVYLPREKKVYTKEQLARLKKMYPKNGTWDRYVKYRVTPNRIKEGVEFIKKYQTIFDQVEKKFKVEKEYIAAIMGIETAYGTNTGNYPVFDTLCTLSFEKNRRNKFFKRELIKFMELAKIQKVNPRNIYGSYAGAIGYGQFMPSNYKAYGVDFDGNGVITLMQPADAIASVANYLKRHKWKYGVPVATEVNYSGKRFKTHKTGYKHTYDRMNLLGISPKGKFDYWKPVRLIKLNRKEKDELWYGSSNFYVITRYNHSSYYAMSVHQLAVGIKEQLNEN